MNVVKNSNQFQFFCSSIKGAYPKTGVELNNFKNIISIY